MSEENSKPTANARVGSRLEVGGFIILVGRCPFCQGTHFHMSRKTSGNLGTRLAHCGKGEYILVVS